MKKIILTILTTLAVNVSVLSQTPGTMQPPGPAPAGEIKSKPSAFGINFTGFVKTDFIFDSRQTVNLREGHFLLFPEKKRLDPDGKDINAVPNFNFLSIQTRLAGNITGPDALGAKTSAYIEGEFFGNINSGINSFRLRHAWIKLNWKSTELMTGQWWHPMFVPECSPATVSFNTGAPFVVFSRNPQLRLSQSMGKFKLALSLLSQVDFVSDGPDGPSPKYLRNSMIPESNLLLQFSSKNPEKRTEFVIGASVNYQVLKPRLVSVDTLTPARDTVINQVPVHINAVTASYQTRATSAALAASFYTKLVTKPLTIKAGAVYGENNNAYVMIGGFAVKSCTDASRGFVDYANLRSMAVWGEVHTNGTRWQPALFGAWAQNLGIGEEVAGPYYARGTDIAYAYRISPRLVFNAGKLRIAGEVEYTVAAYGKTDSKGFVKDPSEIANTRLLLGVFYFF